jgi:hypothetical protein
VGSQRDLHLLCSVAQLALHRRHLHSCLRSGVGYRQANRKQSAHMRRDTWSFRQKASKKKNRGRLPWLGYWKNFHPSHCRMWGQWRLIPEH